MLELPNGDLIVLENGQGVWLTRKAKARRPFNKQAHARRVDAETRLLEQRVWVPAVRKFLFDQGVVMAKRMSSRSRRLARATRDVETRRTPVDEEAARRDATKKAKAMVDEFFNAEEFKNEFIDTVRPLYEETVITALESTGVQLSVDFDVKARKSVEKMITQRANQLAGNVSDTTYEAMKRDVRDGILRGESIPDLAARVQNGLQDASESRATTIARTETVSAYNGGVYEGGKDLPPEIAAGMIWITTDDERTRPAHADADGQIVEMGEPFIVDGEELQYPGDPDGSPENTINCRCATAILTPEDMGSRMVPMHEVSDVLVQMALHDLTYRQALHVLHVSQER